MVKFFKKQTKMAKKSRKWSKIVKQLNIMKNCQKRLKQVKNGWTKMSNICQKQSETSKNC